MTKDKKALWFKRKRYGWGWTPVTWQGWLAVFIYVTFVVVCVATFSKVEELSSATGFSLLGLVLLSSTLTLLWLSYEHGPTPQWRWGKNTDNSPEEDI